VLEKIEIETKKSLKVLNESTSPSQIKSLLKQITVEIDLAICDGDWNLACKLAHYRHEFAKSHNVHDWYTPFLEIRKVRDILELMVKNSNGQ